MCLLVTVKLGDGVRVSVADGITMALPTLTAPHHQRKKCITTTQHKLSEKLKHFRVGVLKQALKQINAQHVCVVLQGVTKYKRKHTPYQCRMQNTARVRL